MDILLAIGFILYLWFLIYQDQRHKKSNEYFKHKCDFDVDAIDNSEKAYPSNIEAPDLYPGSNQWYVDKAIHLKSQKWKDLRELRLKIDKYQCCVCHEKKPLEIHHLTYDRLGNESINDLRSLCRDCHQHQHDKLGYYTTETHNLVFK